MASSKLCNEGSGKSCSFFSFLLVILVVLLFWDWDPTPFYSIKVWPHSNPNLYDSPKSNLSSNSSHNLSPSPSPCPSSNCDPSPKPKPKPNPSSNPILYPSHRPSPNPSPNPSPGLNWIPAEEIVEEDVSSTESVVPDEAIQLEIEERTTDPSRNQHLYKEPTAKASWVQKIELDLLMAKEAISKTSSEYHMDLSPSIYHNVSQFAKSYELMELIFKVFVYKDGSNPFVHVGPTKGIYASEGWFIRGMQRKNQFVTGDPHKAHMFYLPYSVASIVNHLYVPDSHSMLPISTFVRNYVNTIAAKHPFWNRTRGGDHFFVSCHDWGPATARSHWELAHNAMNVVCNADLREGYMVGKDVSLPEIPVHSAKLKLHIGGPGPKKRPFLAFFAGRMHGRVRPTLLHYWKDKDSDMRIYEELPSSIAKSLPYAQHMRMSRFCLCPMGYEVNSPRIVEAIYYDCVPVIIADGFVLPFGDVLKWDAFSITVAERDIPDLKKILLSVPHEKYASMQRNLKAVRQHFMWHLSPVRYDAFHMILHSVWSRRLLQAKL